MRYSDTERIFDELLLTRIKAGDRRAGERLAARWYPRLQRTAYRLLHDEGQAETAVQEAWHGICRGWSSLRDPSRFPAWAYKILHRKCADQIRKNQKYRDKFATSEGNLAPFISASGEEKVTIDQAFSRLSDDHRTSATLYFGEGLTLAEIAEVTSIPLGTAKSRLFHARRQLKEFLGDGNT